MSDTSTAQTLMEEGLKLFSKGRLDHALQQWHAALAVDPKLMRAQEYIDYVTENRAALEQSFDSDGSAAVESDGDIEVDLDDLEDGSFGSGKSDPVHSDVTRKAHSLASLERTAAGLGSEAPKDSMAAKPLAPLGIPDDDVTPRMDLAAMLVDEASQEVAAAQQDRVRKRRVTPQSLSAVPAVGAGTVDSFDQGDRTPVRNVNSLSPEAALGDPISDQELDADAVTPSSISRDRVPVARAEKPSWSSVEAVSKSGEAEFTRAAESTSTELDFSMMSTDVLATVDEEGVAHEDLAAEVQEALRTSGFDVDPDREVKTKPEASLPETDASSRSDAITQPPELEGGEDPDSMLEGAQELHDQGTFEGSMWLCERILQADPKHAAAKILLDRNTDVLLKQYEQKLEDLEYVPQVGISHEQIVWHKLDHRAGFLLSRIDGMLTYEEILDICGMPRFEACRILAQLKEEGVIASGPS